VVAEQPDAAELLVRCLEREGVTVVFGLPGEENIRFTDALARSPIRYLLVRHEQAASFMAEIYGRLTDARGCALPRSARVPSTCCSGWPTRPPTARRS
jgi:thiamine pyrophosphate-dependent acetolactate synthase large subunit-like protein